MVAVLILAFGAPLIHSQTADKAIADTVTASKIATVESLRIVQEKNGPAVEILSTQPLFPSIQAIDDPPRLVIDLPNARVDRAKRIKVEADEISTLRADQFRANPPTARVVVDLKAARAYTWETSGNRLVVHLGKDPGQAGNSPFQPPTVPSLTSSSSSSSVAPPVVASVRADGPLAIAGEADGKGRTITAGADTAVINLSNGGEVRVCPGTTVSAIPAENHHNVMFSMGTGAMETDFVLHASSNIDLDSVLTPDFRILMSGPGYAHYAISADQQGNTCVRALPGNSAPAEVMELLGDRTYPVKATDQLVFRSGRLDHVDMSVPLECGCPPPQDNLLRASGNLPVQNDMQSKSSPGLGTSPDSAEMRHPEDPQTGAGAPLIGSNAASELHVQVSAPFVFRAGPPPAPVEAVGALPFDTRPQAATVLMAALSSPANVSPKSPGAESASGDISPHGFFKKIGAFFASLFH
jgi:hypothetical protein